ncbi:hypothetical protein [Halovivax sp.]|uniref:hypothetical protein n=1 Tax=Halovivax sp. TaxID=1935978 RepID=UPI0025BD0632|nr:hypothetical protein [Halovivax sp.]
MVDRELQESIDGTLVTFDYPCDRHAYEIVMPNRSDERASAMLDGWTGVELVFVDGHERYVPTPETEIAALEAGGERADV